MNILVACEFSGVVRDAFRARGHDAWSCDIIETEVPKSGLGYVYHLHGDVHRVLDGQIPLDMTTDSQWRNTPVIRKWDMLVAFPPCTYLCNSGVRWLYKHGSNWEKIPLRWEQMTDAASFFNTLLSAKIDRIAIENPIMHGHAKALVKQGHTQIIQPWQFGHGETKATCLWLKGLPKLVPTNIVEERHARVHLASPGPNRWKERSRTLVGIAEAMADQWTRG